MSGFIVKIIILAGKMLHYVFSLHYRISNQFVHNNNEKKQNEETNLSYYIRIFILLSAKQVNIYKCFSKITNIVENDKNTLN